MQKFSYPFPFDQIMHGDLRPWLETNQEEEKFALMVSELDGGVPDIEIKYEVDFYRPFSHKTKYYYRLMLLMRNNYCCQVIKVLSESNDVRLTKYYLNAILDKKLRSRLMETGKLIKAYQFDIALINPKCSSFDVDKDHKTETYIIQLLKTIFIVIYLEIQEAFREFRDDILIVEDFYTQLLFEPVPERTFIKSGLTTFNINSETTVSKKAISKEKALIYHSLMYKQYHKKSENINDLCDSLKMNNFIDKSTSTANFKKVFSGKEISNSIRWTGNTSEFYWFIHLIYTKYRFVEDLKQQQWKVAGECFVQEDGSRFDISKLRNMKKPRLTGALLEKAVKLLK